MTLGSARVLGLLVAARLVASISSAHAQSAEAEVLFRDGRALIKQGNLAAGCDKLAGSARLESSTGTLLNLGDCRERLGARATAWAAFRKAEAMARRDNDPKRQAESNRRAVLLEASLSNMIIQIDRRVDGLVIRRNGEVLDVATWNIAVPVDPGTYTISAEAPGYQSWEAVIPMDPRNHHQVVMVPMLQRTTTALPRSLGVISRRTVAPPASRAPVDAIATRPRPHETWTRTRALSLVLGVAGVSVIGGGLYFGRDARALEHQAARRCPLPACDDPEGLKLNDRAGTSTGRASLLYGAGGFAVATAAVMWFIGSPDDEAVVTPTMSSSQVGVSFARRF